MASPLLYFVPFLLACAFSAKDISDYDDSDMERLFQQWEVSGK